LIPSKTRTLQAIQRFSSHIACFMSSRPDPSVSPCIKLCVIDPVTGFCIGCGRTGAEIGGWLAMSLAERAALNAALPARLAGMTSRETRCQTPRRGRSRRD